MLLEKSVAALSERRWGNVIDSGWSDWDLEIHRHPWTTMTIRTAQEVHGKGKHLIRVCYQLKPTDLGWTLGAFGILSLIAATSYHVGLGISLAVVLALLAAGVWRRGRYLGKQVIQMMELVATDLKMSCCEPSSSEPNPEQSNA